MGLSDSVLSCLPFIAGLLYLIDPLRVCIYVHAHTHICVRACRRKYAAVVCGLEPVYNLYCIVVELQTQRYLIQATGKAVCDDKSQWESKLP